MRLRVLLVLALTATRTSAAERWGYPFIIGKTFSPPAAPIELARYDFNVPGCYNTGSVFGSHGETLNSTRSGTRLCQTGATTLITCQANQLCVEAREPQGVLGLAIESQRQNAIPFSASPCSAGDVVTSPWSLTDATCRNDVALDPVGTSSFDEITNSVNTGGAKVTDVGSAQATKYWVGSSWVRRTDPGPVTVGVVCEGKTLGACSCYRTDQGACTTQMVGNVCYATASAVTTEPVRLAALTYCNSATGPLHPSIWLVPGEYGVSTGTAQFWGSQLEGSTVVGTNNMASRYLSGTIVNDQASSYTRRSAQTFTLATAPALAGVAPYCVKMLVTSLNHHAVDQYDLTYDQDLYWFGGVTGANRLTASAAPTSLGMLIADSGGTVRQTSAGTFGFGDPSQAHWLHQGAMYANDGRLHIVTWLDGRPSGGGELSTDGTLMLSGVATPMRLGGSYGYASGTSAATGKWVRSFVVLKGPCR